jgi:hypothetical protein
MGCCSTFLHSWLDLDLVADRSPGNTIFVYACTSTAMLCPLIFGFPTEMWLAHAIFWLVPALSHYARQTVAASMLVFVAELLLAFSTLPGSAPGSRDGLPGSAQAAAAALACWFTFQFQGSRLATLLAG